MAIPRIYLTGRISIEHGSTLVEERELAGRQARLALALLVSERHQPMSKDHLMAVVWPDGTPREPDICLSAILSKLRGTLKKARLSDSSSIDMVSGTVQMRLPSDTWIDLEHAANALDDAEGALRSDDTRRAWGDVMAVVTIARRPFLPAENGAWVEARRVRLRGLLLRALQVLSQVSLANREPALAIQYANEIVEIDPFHEPGYRLLMQTHAQIGNRAEALRVFGRCRELFREELGAAPSDETERVFLDILRA